MQVRSMFSQPYMPAGEAGGDLYSAELQASKLQLHLAMLRPARWSSR
jgi:hypothetical protein